MKIWSSPSKWNTLGAAAVWLFASQEDILTLVFNPGNLGHHILPYCYPGILIYPHLLTVETGTYFLGLKIN